MSVAVRSVSRTNNYIGKFYSGKTPVNAIFDDLRLFNRTLNNSEIQSVMQTFG